MAADIKMQPVELWSFRSRKLLKNSNPCFLRIFHSLKKPELRFTEEHSIMRTIFFLSAFIFLISCGEKEKPKKPKYTEQQVKDLSVQMNTWDEKRQHDEIDQYIKAHGWQMETTASGIYYMKLKSGKGEQAHEGQTAKVNYKISLLDGSVVYSSDETGPKEFLIGKDNVESGLHEGVQMMHVGDKMRFILPSFRAHGLTGDNSKIPPLTSVVYEIELLGLTTK
jgi:FKBP-type peptidyl-prolyl cis-trans isomerase